MDQHAVDAWYLETARYFSGMGFFSKYSRLSAEQLAVRIKEDVCRQWDEPLPAGAEQDPQLADMYMLATDEERVWQADLECVYPGEQAYVRFLNALAVISRGAFSPQHIAETWKGERGPIEVEFTADGTRHKFIHKGGDMLDPSIIHAINPSMQTGGVCFEASDRLGMPNFIVALTRDEKMRLAARGWKFWSGK